jgi:outer membrane protein TolC
MIRVVLTWTLLSCIGFAQPRKSLSLEDAIEIGLQQNKVLMASSKNVDVASARASEVNTALLPSLTFESSYQRLSEVDPFQVVVPFSPTPVTLSPIVLDNYKLKLSLRQPVFTGFRLRSNARAAEFAAQATEYEYHSDKSDLILNIKNAYWMLYQTIEVKNFVDENVNLLQVHLKDTENLMNAGLATRNDLLKIEVQHSDARLAQIDATHDVRVATMNLNNVIGQPLDTELRLTSQPARRSGGPGPQQKMSEDVSRVHSLVSTAHGARADLKSMEFRIKAEDASVSAAQGDWWPQIFLAGNYYYSRPNPRVLPTRDEFKGTWDIGLMLQFDVWNWGATSNRTQQAQAGLNRTEYLYEQMKDNVSLEVTRSYLQVERSSEKVEVARLSIAQAEENARSTNEKYKNGLATSSDLLDADVALLHARTNLTGALVEFELAQARLSKAIGNEK